MESARPDPKQGERTYYARLGADGMAHARGKPFSDAACGKYLADMGCLMQMLLPAPRRILDLGCGTGWTSRFLAKAGYQVVGVDISPQAIEAAAECARLEGVGGVGFECADYESWSGAADFDYALFYDALHHAEDESLALACAFRALKPAGVLFALEPGRGHSRDPRSMKAVGAYGVHEKDMPPSHVWAVGRKVGFRRAAYLPLPHDVARAVYRRDYLGSSGFLELQLERLWSFYRLFTTGSGTAGLGMTVLWK